MTYKISQNEVALVTAPTVEPVSLTEMKVHCDVQDTSDYDTILSAMITASREYVEKRLQMALVQRTYRADVAGFADRFRLPYPPLASITSIKYYTTDSPQVLTTLATNFYRHDLGRAEIYRDYSVSGLPSVSTRHDAVQITYVAGYAPTTDSPQSYTGNVPEAIKSAIKLQAADLFENRDIHATLRMQELPTVNNLLSAYREY